MKEIALSHFANDHIAQKALRDDKKKSLTTLGNKNSFRLSSGNFLLFWLSFAKLQWKNTDVKSHISATLC